MQKFITILMVVFTAFWVNFSNAQSGSDQSGPTVGNALLDINAANLMNAATGKDSSVTQNVGSIEAGKVSNLESNVNAGDAMNAATGDNTCADQAIGTIGHKTACERNK